MLIRASSNFAAPKTLRRSLPPGFTKASTPVGTLIADRMTTRDPSEFPSGRDSLRRSVVERRTAALPNEGQLLHRSIRTTRFHPDMGFHILPHHETY